MGDCIKRWVILLGAMVWMGVSFAKSSSLAIMDIVPSLTNTTVRTDGITVVQFTVSANALVKSLRIDPAFKSKGNKAGLLLQSSMDNCTGRTLAIGETCTFQILIKNQLHDFILRPRVCAGNAVCSQPTVLNRTQINVVKPIGTSLRAFMRLISGPNANTLLPLFVPSNVLSDPLPGFSSNATGLGVAVATNGARVYVVNRGPDVLQVVDATIQPLAIIASIPIGNNATGVAITPNDKKIYVVNNGSASVTVIDATTNTVITTIPTVGGISDIAISPDGSRAYVTGGNNITIIDIATDTVIATIPALTSRGVAVSQNGTLLYISNTGSNVVSVYTILESPPYLTLVTTIPVGVTPVAIAVNPNGLEIYVSNTASNEVSIINTLTNTVTNTVPVSINPEALATTPNGRLLYVTQRNSSVMSVISLSSEEVTFINVTGQQSGRGSHFIG